MYLRREQAVDFQRDVGARNNQMADVPSRMGEGGQRGLRAQAWGRGRLGGVRSRPSSGRRPPRPTAGHLCSLCSDISPCRTDRLAQPPATFLPRGSVGTGQASEATAGGPWHLGGRRRVVRRVKGGTCGFGTRQLGPET